MPGGDVLARGVDVVQRVVEEDVGAEHVQERPLGAAAEEQCLVQAHAPLAQGANHAFVRGRRARGDQRSEEHTSELQSLMRISYAVFCLQKKKNINTTISKQQTYSR